MRCVPFLCNLFGGFAFLTDDEVSDSRISIGVTNPSYKDKPLPQGADQSSVDLNRGCDGDG